MTGPARGYDHGEPPAVLDEQVTVATAAQMRYLGERLSGLLRAGDLVVLSGPLGAGKTTLAQGIGAGLGIRGQVTSPTFVIARVHPSLGAGPDLVHADAYRLGSRAEVDDLDLDADLASAVTVVEWGAGLVEDLADSFLSVTIDLGAGPAAAADADAGPRTVRVQGSGERWQQPGSVAAAQQAVTGVAAYGPDCPAHYTSHN
ncbi:MAG: tRNA (adenosine(37)-N6)-threonylcarbamoyltransferase complex ATPase subunit type 1 TsaE [Streptosporangiaceae bacterium]